MCRSSEGGWPRRGVSSMDGGGGGNDGGDDEFWSGWGVELERRSEVGLRVTVWGILAWIFEMV